MLLYMVCISIAILYSGHLGPHTQQSIKQFSLTLKNRAWRNCVGLPIKSHHYICQLFNNMVHFTGFGKWFVLMRLFCHEVDVKVGIKKWTIFKLHWYLRLICLCITWTAFIKFVLLNSNLQRIKVTHRLSYALFWYRQDSCAWNSIEKLVVSLTNTFNQANFIHSFPRLCFNSQELQDCY